MIRERFGAELRARLAEDDWLVLEETYRPRENLVNESLFTLCSGRMSSRGAHEEAFVSHSLPAHYVHGVFDRSEAFQRELCNTPDWAKLKLYYKREPIGPETGRGISEYLRVLDLRGGFLAKHYIHEDESGRRTRVESIKLLSRSLPECGAFRLWLTPLNYGGSFEFENIIDATVSNFIDYPRFRVKHLNIRELGSLDEDGCFVQSETRDFLLPLCTAARVDIRDLSGRPRRVSRQYRGHGELACEFMDAEAGCGETLVLSKFAAVVCGNRAKPLRAAARECLDAAMARGFDALLDDNASAYAALWERADVEIDGDAQLQKALRFSLFHLMSTPDPEGGGSNIGAKLLHGEEYGGHAFWDTELFILPFFNLVFPEQAKKLVDYRYQLLEGAKRNARLRGGRGARFPWESADTGDEECPAWTIEGDGTAYPCTVADQELHVTAAVIYGGLQYAAWTRDAVYSRERLPELLAETARFWFSRLEWNEGRAHWELTGVTGPDEWHEDVSNSTYTNYLARWNMRKAVQLLRAFKTEDPDAYAKLAARIRLGDEELAEIAARAERIYLPATDGLIEEFEGYFGLLDAPVEAWDEGNMPLLPEALKGIARAQTSIIKQADIVMLMFLFPDDFSLSTQRENYLYYERRCLHRSSLSAGIHALMGLRVGEGQSAYEYLERSLYVDLENRQGNTREGLHAASIGGSWQCVVFGFAGLTISASGELYFDPKLPERWRGLRFNLFWRERLLRVDLSASGLRLRCDRACDFGYFHRAQPCAIEVDA